MMTSSTPVKIGGLFVAATAGMSLFALPAIAVDTSIDQVPIRAVSAIDWKAAGSAVDDLQNADATVGAAFKASSPAGFDDVTLPIMILGAEAAVDLPAFQGQGSAYSAYYKLEDAQLSVMGAKTRLVDVPGLSFVNESYAYESIGDGADHMLSRFGAFYTLRITCDAPTKDARCIKPDYLAELATTLIIVKGDSK
ncbi:hypothetical protein [Phaeobacter sp. C3_T13_0]|uniref:hypothetical protein n=1 Tax=Phaeobacter cretensis TaxID=3342641 RepID=UPI0039BD1A51